MLAAVLLASKELSSDVGASVRRRGFAAMAILIGWFLLCVGLGLALMGHWFRSDVVSWASRATHGVDGWLVVDGVWLVVALGVPAYLLGKSLYFFSLWTVFSTFRPLDDKPGTPMDEKYGLAFDIPDQLSVCSMLQGEIYPRKSIQRHFLRDIEKLEQAGSEGKSLAAPLVQLRNKPHRRDWQHRDLSYLTRSLGAVGLSSSTLGRIRPEVMARRRAARDRVEELVSARFDAWIESGAADEDCPFKDEDSHSNLNNGCRPE